MDRSAHREIPSAAIDGEATPAEVRAAGAHVSTCGGCRAWREAATGVTRAARLVPVDPVPDLAAAVLQAAPPVARRLEAAPDASSALRIGPVPVAVAPLLVVSSDLPPAVVP